MAKKISFNYGGGLRAPEVLTGYVEKTFNIGDIPFLVVRCKRMRYVLHQNYSMFHRHLTADAITEQFTHDFTRYRFDQDRINGFIARNYTAFSDTDEA